MHYYLSFVKYLFCSKHRRGFGVHSPFVFNLITNVIEEHLPYYKFGLIEKVRELLLKTDKTVYVEDFGTGKSGTQRIASIVKKSAKSASYAQILFRLVNYYKSENILELGTSFGLTTMYLAAPSSKAKVVTIEGCKDIAYYARLSFKRAGFDNIEVVNDNIDNSLSSVLNRFQKLDFVFMDANHTKNALLSYYSMCSRKIHSKTLFVIDDIHWSKEMEEAWNEIKEYSEVRVSIDMFSYGILLFDPDLQKESYSLFYVPQILR